MFAFTADTTGGNLPAVYAPWHELNRRVGGRVFRKNPGISPRAAIGVITAVQEDGYCLACSRSTLGRVGQNLKAIEQ
jgi:hypothetical protein